MAYDNSLDPLGDGSLLESYRFESSQQNEQSTRSFDTTGSFVGGKYGKAKQIGAGATSQTSGSPFVGNVDASFSFWLNSSATDAGGIDIGSRWGSNWFGGWTWSTSDTYVNMLLGIGGQYTYGGFSVDAGWIFITCTYEASTGIAKMYIGDVEKQTKTQATTFSSSKIQITQYDDDKVTTVDQIMLFNKVLSVADIQTLMAITEAPSPDAEVLAGSLGTMVFCPKTPQVNFSSADNNDSDYDPLGNGSLVASYPFDNNFESIQALKPFSASGTVTHTTGKLGDAVTMVEPDSLVTSGSFLGDESHSIAFWAYLDGGTSTFQVSVGGTKIKLYSSSIDNSSASGKQQTYLSVRGYTTRLLDWSYNGWYHFTYVYDKCDGSSRLEIDTIYTLKITRNPQIDTSMNIKVTAHDAGTTAKVDQLMFFKCALGAGEIASLRDSMTHGSPAINVIASPPVCDPVIVTMQNAIAEGVVGDTTAYPSDLGTLTQTINDAIAHALVGDTLALPDSLNLVASIENPTLLVSEGLIAVSSSSMSISLASATVIAIIADTTATPTSEELMVTLNDPVLYLSPPPPPRSAHITDFFDDGFGKHLWNFDDRDTNDEGSATISSSGTHSWHWGKYSWGCNTTVDEVQSFSDLSGQNQTYSGWYKIDTNSDTSDKVLLRLSGTQSAQQVTLYAKADGTIKVRRRNITITFNGRTISPDTWTHITFVMNGSQQVGLKVNNGGLSFWDDDTDSVPPVKLTFDGDTDVQRDAIRIFNRALTHSEIEEVATEESTHFVPQLIEPQAFELSTHIYTPVTVIQTISATVMELYTDIFTPFTKHEPVLIDHPIGIMNLSVFDVIADNGGQHQLINVSSLDSITVGMITPTVWRISKRHLDIVQTLYEDGSFFGRYKWSALDIKQTSEMNHRSIGEITQECEPNFRFRPEHHTPLSVVHSVELLTKYPFDIKQGVWSGYDVVTRLPVYGIFNITHKLGGSTGARTFISRFEHTQQLETDFKRNGYLNKRAFPMDFKLHIPFWRNDVKDVFGDGGVTTYSVWGGSVKHKDGIGNMMYGTVTYDNTIPLTGDFTFCGWTNPLKDGSGGTLNNSTGQRLFSDRNTSGEIDVWRDNDANGTLGTIGTSRIIGKYGGIKDGSIHFFSLVRRSGVIKAYMNLTELTLTGVVDFYKTSTVNISGCGFWKYGVGAITAYDRALNLVEIKGIFDEVTPFAQPLGMKQSVVSSSDVFYAKNIDLFTVVYEAQRDSSNVVSRLILQSENKIDPNTKKLNRIHKPNRDIIAGCVKYYPLQSSWDEWSGIDNGIQYTKLYDPYIFPKRLFGGGVTQTAIYFKETGINMPEYNRNTSFDINVVRGNARYTGVPFTGKRVIFQPSFSSGSSKALYAQHINSTTYALETDIYWYGAYRVSRYCLLKYDVSYTICLNYFDDIYSEVFVNGERKSPVDDSFNPTISNYPKKMYATTLFGAFFDPSHKNAGRPIANESSVGNIRQYKRRLTKLDAEILYNDPFLVIGQYVQQNVIYRFDFESDIEDMDGRLFLPRVLNSDPFNDKSVMHHWSYAGDAHDKGYLENNRGFYYRDAHSNSGWKRVCHRGGTIDKERFGYIKTGLSSLNQEMSSSTYTLTFSSNHDLGYSGGIISETTSYGWAIHEKEMKINKWVEGGDHYVWSITYKGMGWKTAVQDSNYFVGWYDIAMTVREFKYSRVCEVGMYMKGVFLGYSYYEGRPFGIIKNRVKDTIIPYQSFAIGKAQGFAMGTGGMRVFDRVLNANEILSLTNNDMALRRWTFEFRHENQEYLVEHDSIFLRHQLKPDYYKFDTIGIVDPFGDNSGELLWKMDGNYLEESGNGYKTEGGGQDFAWDDDGVFGRCYRSPYGNTGFRFGLKKSIPTHYSVSWHQQLLGSTFTSTIGTISFGGSNGTHPITFNTGSSILGWGEKHILLVGGEINEWTHFAVTTKYHPETTIAGNWITVTSDLWINGKWRARSYGSRTQTFSFINLGTHSKSSSPFNGRLDQLRVFNRPLTEREIKQLGEEKVAPLASGISHRLEAFSTNKADIVHKVEDSTSQSYNIVQDTTRYSIIYKFNIVASMEESQSTMFIQKKDI